MGLVVYKELFQRTACPSQTAMLSTSQIKQRVWTVSTGESDLN